MKFLKNKIEIILLVIAVLFGIGCIIYAYSNDSNSNTLIDDEYNVGQLGSKWTVTYSDGTTRKVSIPMAYDNNHSDMFILRRELPEDIQLGDAIFFKSNHSRIYVSVEGKRIYEYYWSYDAHIGSTPGSTWNMVELDPSYAGKEIAIYVKSPYSMYQGSFREIYYGRKSDLINYIYREKVMQVVLSIVPLLVGLIMLLIAVFVGRLLSAKLFMNMALFLLVASAWEIIESDIFLITHEYGFSISFLKYAIFGLMPAVVALVLNTVDLIKYHFRIVMIVNIVSYFVYVGLQMMNISDMAQNTWIVHLLMLLNAATMMLDGKKLFFEIEEKMQFVYMFGSFMILIIGYTVDLFRFYVDPNSDCGKIIRWCMVIFIICMILSMLYMGVNKQRANIEKETILNMAYTDNLTGIRNRRCFEVDVEKLVDNKKNFTIVAVDMNNLKMINDELGHKFGDEALIKVANGLKKFEEYGEKCYRMGGDEFEVICVNINGAQIDDICSEINNELAKTEYFPGKPLAMAYGYHRYSANTDKEVNKIMAMADKKMYEHKAKMKAMGYATRS